MRTTLQIDKKTSKRLGLLSSHQHRTKADQIRFLIEKEIATLKILEKMKK
jgi:predicted DNA-binding protein